MGGPRNSIPADSTITASQAETTSFTGRLARSRAFHRISGQPDGTIEIRIGHEGEFPICSFAYAGIVAIILLMSLPAALLFSTIFKDHAQPIVELAGVARMVSREKNTPSGAASGQAHDEIALLMRRSMKCWIRFRSGDAALHQAHERLESGAEILKA